MAGSGTSYDKSVNIALSDHLYSGTLAVQIGFYATVYSSNTPYTWTVTAYDANNDKVGKTTLSNYVSSIGSYRFKGTISLGKGDKGKTIKTITYLCTSAPSNSSNNGFRNPDYQVGTLSQETWGDITLTSVKFADNGIVPVGGTIKLSWTGSGGTNNAITGYTISCTGQTTLTAEASSSSITITAPSTGKTYTYYVKATGACSTVTQSVTLEVYGQGTVPTAVQIGSASTKTNTYLCKSASTFTLKWSGATAGENNKITAYQYSLDNGSTWSGNITATSVSISTSKYKTGNYIRVRAVFQYSGVSAQSSAWARVIIIDSISTPTITSSTSITTNSNQTITWNAIGVSGTTVSYRLTYKNINGATTTINSSSTSASITISDLAIGSQTSISLVAIATATFDSSTVTSEAAICNITRVTTLSNTTITGLYDKNKTGYSTTDITSRAYNSITINWTAVSPSTSDTSVKYNLSYLLNNSGSYISLATGLTALTYTFNPINKIANVAGKTLKFQIHAYDANASSDTYSNTVTILSIPTFTSTPTASSNQDNQTVVAFKYNNDTGSGDNIEYNIEMCQTTYQENGYNSYVQLASGTFISTTSASYSSTFTITPKTATASENNLQAGLYYAMRAGYGKPSGKLRVTLTREYFSACTTYVEVNMSFDLRRSITSAATFDVKKAISDTVTVTGGNPGTERYFILNTACKHYYADATLTTDDSDCKIIYSYTISKDNETITVSNDQAKITLPEAISHLSLNYIVTTTATYIDNYTVTKSYTVPLEVYRWYADATYIENIDGDGTAFKCNIALPTYKYADYENDYLNLVSIKCDTYIVGSETAINTQTLSTKQACIDTDTIQVNYTLPATRDSDYSIIAKITATNNDGQQLLIDTQTVVVRVGVINMGIRHHRIGININNNFGVADNDKTQGALTVFNDPGQATPSIEAIVDSANASPLVIKKGDTTISSFNIAADDFLTISNLFKTAVVTLTLNSSQTTYTITNPYITNSTTQQISFYYDSEATLATNQQRYKLLQKAIFIGTAQEQGNCTLTAFGKLPTTDTQVKILLTVRGG